MIGEMMCRLPLMLIASAVLASVSQGAEHFSNVDCSFDHSTRFDKISSHSIPLASTIRFSSADSGFCQWRPDHAGALLWRTGNAVLVDAGIDRFAFVQGRYGLPTEGRIQSPLVNDSLGEAKSLQLSYWKAATGPTLDICLRDTSMKTDEEINCLDSITGPGQQQWIRRCIDLPRSDLPFRIVFKARHILSAEDIVCIDDIRLISTSSGAGDDVMLRRGWDDDDVAHNELQAVEGDEDRGKAEGARQSLVPFQKKFPSSHGMRPTWSTPTPRQKTTNLPRPQTFNFNTKKIHSDYQSSSKGIGFPEFPSFSDGLSPNPELKRPAYPPQLPDKTSPIQYCKAVHCSFIADTCLWRLGPSWRQPAITGSISMDTPGDSSVTSARFKVPLASLVEFDLWMSDDALLVVAEQMEPLPYTLPPAGSPPEVMLFSRRGMANNGWHRFRVPLRPSYQPVRVRFSNSLPPGAFITLSNLRLVNGAGEEVPCETVAEAAESLRAQPATNGGSGTLTPLFNPFRPMLVEGLIPIVPVRYDPQRLTALQREPHLKSVTSTIPITTTPSPTFTAPPKKASSPIPFATAFGIPNAAWQQLEGSNLAPNFDHRSDPALLDEAPPNPFHNLPHYSSPPTLTTLIRPESKVQRSGQGTLDEIVKTLICRLASPDRAS